MAGGRSRGFSTKSFLIIYTLSGYGIIFVVYKGENE